MALPRSTEPISQAPSALSKLSKLLTIPKRTPTKLPCTSPTRLSSNDEKTILYLAYGSNLSAETFKGARGIKPLSAVNVHVPSLKLTFDLPGIPYVEPCFANTQYRNSPSTPPTSSTNSPDYHKDRWTKGLIGVVYEVTPEDYRTIIATEGGGASYHDVVVPCFVLPEGSKIVEEEPKGVMFKAHTLLSPRDVDPELYRNTNNRGTVEAKRGATRPDPSYAQPSARYLKLITDGAEEHSLPAEYMAYLDNIRPYTITTRKQKMGQKLFLAVWMPVLMVVLGFSKLLADEDGRVPAWWVVVMTAMFKGVWTSYDLVFKKMFGDGERTIYGDGEDDDEKNLGMKWGCRRGCIRLGSGDEKNLR